MAIAVAIKDVLRFEVAMDNAAGVEVGDDGYEGVCGSARVGLGVMVAIDLYDATSSRERRTRAKTVTHNVVEELFTFEQLENEVEVLLGFEVVEQADDVRVIQLS